jgi:hypothetical protein
MHYQQAQMKGSRHEFKNRTDRAWEFVEKCVNSDTDKCLVPAFKKKAEYPTLKHKGKEYRLAWLVLEKTKGDRPEGLEMRHLCGNSRCCNPRHLAWGTHLENMEDQRRHGTNIGRIKFGEKNQNAKLTDAQREEIIRRHKPGRGTYDRSNTLELAKEFGVTGCVILAMTRKARQESK